MSDSLVGLSPDQIRAIPEGQYQLLTAMVDCTAPVIREYVAEEIAKAVAPLKRQAEMLEAENAKLRGEIASIKALPRMEYRGVWAPNTEKYPSGSVCTWEGSAWVALRDTDQKPGSGGSNETGWQLAVKRGSDAPKGTATPRGAAY